MVTRVLDARKADALAAAAEAAARTLQEGGIVAIPTDTVYGLAVRADDDAVVKLLFEVKRRRDENPLPILLADVDDLERVAGELSAAARELARRFWPGQLTLVIPKSDAVSDLVTAGKPTVGVRVPDHPVTRAVLRACPFLVAVTSANVSALPPARDVDEARRTFSGRVNLILAADRCPGGVPSTVVDVTVNPPRILRAGSVSSAEITNALRALA